MKFRKFVVATTMALLAGCGLPNEGRFIPLSREQVPDALTAPSTSTPTTSVPDEAEASPTTVTDAARVHCRRDTLQSSQHVLGDLGPG